MVIKKLLMLQLTAMLLLISGCSDTTSDVSGANPSSFLGETNRQENISDGNTQEAFLFGVNIKGNGVTVEGNSWLGEAEAGVSISSGTSSATTNLTPIPQVDADTATMLNSVRWKRNAWDISKTIANGEYRVELWIMENYKSNVRNIDITVEENSQASIGNLARGAWEKYSYDVSVEDGKLDIAISSSHDAHIMGFAVYKKGTTPPPPTEDTTPPVITLNGQSTINLNVGETYVDAGASATDNVDGDITANIVTVNTVDTSTAGSYTVTYDVNDSAGNEAQQVSRTVIVQEGDITPPPVDTQEQFIFGVNIKGNGVTVEGNSWLGEAEAGVSISSGTSSTTTNLVPSPQVDADTATMLNSVRWKRNAWDISKTIANGEYRVELWIMENYKSNVRNMDITVEEHSQASIGNLARGAWEKYSYDVSVEDGKLDIAIKSSHDAHIMGFAVYKKGTTPPPPTEDTTPPVITLNGQSTITLNVGATYVDAGASASDNVDGDITANIVTVNTVDTTTAGTYTVTYDVNDSAGNEAEKVNRTVVINEETACVKNTNIIKDGTFENKSTYTTWIKTAGDARILRKSYNAATGPSLGGNGGKYVLRAKDGQSVTAEQTIDISQCAGENLSYDFRAELGGYGDGDNVEVKILFKDTNNDIISVYTTEPFTSNRVMTAFTTTANLPNNTSKVTIQLTFKRLKGTYIDGYVDNLSLVIKEGIIEEEITPPTITLLGDNPINITVGDTYTDAGATAIDDVDGNITANIVTVSTVDTSTAGSYTVTYDVNDTAGNNAVQVIRTVVVNTVVVPDTTAPVITLNGEANVSINVGETYTDAGATATDNVDGDVTASIVTVSTVDTSTAGSYTVTYDVNDTAGNNAVQVIRTVVVNTVVVPDTTAPVITLNGEANVSINVGETYTDAGATATDNVDGDVTASIVTVSTVDTSTAGTYTVTYDVNDTVGNKAQQVSRTVVVESAIVESTVTGRIVAENGATLSNVTVVVFQNSVKQNISTTTDSSGKFTLDLVANGEYTLLFTKEGYANQIKAIKVPEVGHSIGFDMTMIPRGAAQVLPDTPSVTLNGNDGASVTLPPQFEDAEGNPVSASDGVTLTITPVDVTSPAGLAIFPGDFAGVAENETEPTPIISYGTTEFHFTRNSDGAELQLAPGNEAEILLPIYTDKHPDGTAIALGDSIALWSLNEKTGVWLQEGTGEVVAASTPSGFALKATVSHFTWWNVDAVISDVAYVDITVNAPAEGTALVKVRAELPWGLTQADTVVPVGISTGSLDIPDGIEVCFWAEVSFPSTNTVITTAESCITADAGSTNNITLTIEDDANTPLEITATRTSISRAINTSIGQIKIQPTTFESSVTYTIDSGTLPNGVSLQSIDATTAVISGVASEAGTFTVVVKGVNAEGEESSVNVAIEILEEGIIPALTREELIELIKNWAENPSQENADKIINANTSEITDMSELFAVTSYWQSLNPYIASATLYPNITGTGLSTLGSFNLDISRWDVSSVTNMSRMFKGMMFNQNINNWNVSSVTDMSEMFREALNFNQPLNNWDVSSVTNMSKMFYGYNYERDRDATFNQPLNNWNVSSVTDMSSMFAGTPFNQDISSWNVSSVTDMSSMFEGTPFNQDISSWNVSNVTDMSSMFNLAQVFNQDISRWNVSNVTNMSSMFRYAQFNQDIGDWNVSNVTDMSAMFSFITAFNQDIGDWNVSNVTNMSAMFSSTTDFNQDISRWNVSNVTNMSIMFRYTQFNQDIGDWNVSNVTSMSGMFEYTQAFNQDIGDWNVSNVTYMSDMFDYTQAFNQDISSWNVSNVTNMNFMFARAQEFNQDISSWDVSSVNSYYNFSSGSPLTAQNTPNFP